VGLAAAETWRRIVDRAAACRPFLGRERLDGKRMHGTGDLCGKQTVDRLMACDPALAREGVSDRDHLEMGFRIRGHAVPVAFVDHLEMCRRQRCAQLALDCLLNGHAGCPSLVPSPTRAASAASMN